MFFYNNIHKKPPFKKKKKKIKLDTLQTITPQIASSHVLNIY